MRSIASSGPCLVRLSRIAKLRENRWVSTASRFFPDVRDIWTQPAQPILNLTFFGFQSRRENGCHALMERPQFIERAISLNARLCILRRRRADKEGRPEATFPVLSCRTANYARRNAPWLLRR